MRILRLILGQGLALSVLGVAAGLLAGFALSRFLESALYGVTATDTVVFVLAPLLLLAVALLAMLPSARRAVAMDPSSLLRME